MSKMIDVCCAIIPDAGKILAVQRGPESSHPWQWEFPGGKIQENETAEMCIVREIQEELSISVVVVAGLKAVDFDYGFRQILLIPFVCRMVSGKIRLTEHVGLKWLEVQELQGLNWSEADRKLIYRNEKSLLQLMQKASGNIF